MNVNTPDKYDIAVQYLKEHPNEIGIAWLTPFKHIAGCLFQLVEPKNEALPNVGCLTTIKAGYHQAYTSELTISIRNDERLPSKFDDITLDHLDTFAEWQRRIDVILNRT